jgi:outer membrane protein
MKSSTSRRSIKSPAKLIIALTLAFAPVVISAQTPQPATNASQPGAVALSLDAAVRMAEAQSEAVRIARAGVQRSQGTQLQARSQLFPQISGTGSYTRTLKSQYSGSGIGGTTDTTTAPASPAPPCDDYLLGETASIAERVAGLETASRCASGLNPFAAFSSLPFGQANQYSLGLGVSQNLFSGGRVSAQNAAAAAGHRSAAIELTAQRAQNILDVAQAYYDAALADRLVSIADASFTQTENVLRQVQLNKNVGNVSEFELLRAQVTRDNQRPQLIQRRSDREVAYLRLKQLLNIPLEQPVSLTTSIDEVGALPEGIRLAGLTITSPETPDTSATNRAAVRQASEAVRAQQELVRVAKSQRLPSLTLSSQYGGVAYPTGGLPGRSDFRTNWTVTVGTAIPIFTGGRIRGDELIAQANLAESRARLQQVREFASLDARVALNALNQAAASWEASRGTAEQATRAYTIAEVRYREGISTQLELNDSRILVEQAVANRALAARNLQIARLKLALLSNLPLSTGGAGQGTSTQTQQQQSTQQQAAPQQTPGTQQQGQAQQGTVASQQIPPGL